MVIGAIPDYRGDPPPPLPIYTFLRGGGRHLQIIYAVEGHPGHSYPCKILRQRNDTLLRKQRQPLQQQQRSAVSAYLPIRPPCG